ncbi:response regulator [Holophaga foetida]|uniref:response regulator n=1 Tax=Holophaga foetida TaxID=35839 RepID=UPI0002475300|nr:response regulator [Holophaga foetida]
MNILTIDDARFQRGQMVRMLTEMGHTVKEAVNGQDGFMTMLQEVPDAVICDLLMPVLDGFALLALVQKHQIDIPVVIVSADVQESSREECLRLGARAFLNKPCRREDLEQVLKAIEAGRSVE